MSQSSMALWRKESTIFIDSEFTDLLLKSNLDSLMWTLLCLYYGSVFIPFSCNSNTSWTCKLASFSLTQLTFTDFFCSLSSSSKSTFREMLFKIRRGHTRLRPRRSSSHCPARRRSSLWSRSIFVAALHSKAFVASISRSRNRRHFPWMGRIHTLGQAEF